MAHTEQVNFGEDPIAYIDEAKSFLHRAILAKKGYADATYAAEQNIRELIKLSDREDRQHIFLNPFAARVKAQRFLNMIQENTKKGIKPDTYEAATRLLTSIS